MPGFPNRPSRYAYGPKRADDGVLPDDENYVGAKTFNLEHWQTAGLGAVSDRAKALIVFTGPDAVAVTTHAEAWNPNGTIAAPTVERVAQGHYKLTYAATYLDDDDVAIATGITAGAATAQGATPLKTSVSVDADGKTVHVYLTDGADAEQDSSVWVRLF